MWRLSSAEPVPGTSVDSFADLSAQYMVGLFGLLESQYVLETEEDDEVKFGEPVIPRKNRTMWDRQI